MSQIAKCGCANDTCACVVQAGEGVTVTGTGSPANPYVVSSPETGEFTVVDTPSINHTLSGDGTLATPYVLQSDVNLDPSPQNILQVGPNGFGLLCSDVANCIPAEDVANVGCGLIGNGSALNPVRIHGLSPWPYACPEINGRRLWCGADNRVLADPAPTCIQAFVPMAGESDVDAFCTVVPNNNTRTVISDLPNRLVINNPDPCRPMLLDIRAGGRLRLTPDPPVPPQPDWINQMFIGVLVNGALYGTVQNIGVGGPYGAGVTHRETPLVPLTIPAGGSVTLGSTVDGASVGGCFIFDAQFQHPLISVIGRTCG